MTKNDLFFIKYFLVVVSSRAQSRGFFKGINNKVSTALDQTKNA